MKFSISLENFNPGLDNSPHREPYFQSRLKCSISIENLNLRLVWAIPPVRLALPGRNSGKILERTPETLSERFLEFPSRVRLGCPKSYTSRHLRLPEHFQNSLPPSTAGGASFFRSGSGEGLPEPVMEFPAVLGVFLMEGMTAYRGIAELVSPIAASWATKGAVPH